MKKNGNYLVVKWEILCFKLLCLLLFWLVIWVGRRIRKDWLGFFEVGFCIYNEIVGYLVWFFYLISIMDDCRGSWNFF